MELSHTDSSLSQNFFKECWICLFVSENICCEWEVSCWWDSLISPRMLQGSWLSSSCRATSAHFVRMPVVLASVRNINTTNYNTLLFHDNLCLRVQVLADVYTQRCTHTRRCMALIGQRGLWYQFSHERLGAGIWIHPQTCQSFAFSCISASCVLTSASLLISTHLLNTCLVCLVFPTWCEVKKDEVPPDDEMMRSASISTSLTPSSVT